MLNTYHKNRQTEEKREQKRKKLLMLRKGDNVKRKGSDQVRRVDAIMNNFADQVLLRYFSEDIGKYIGGRYKISEVTEIL